MSHQRKVITVAYTAPFASDHILQSVSDSIENLLNNMESELQNEYPQLDISVEIEPTSEHMTQKEEIAKECFSRHVANGKSRKEAAPQAVKDAEQLLLSLRYRT